MTHPSEPTPPGPAPAEGFRRRIGVPLWVVTIAVGAVILAGLLGWVLAAMLTTDKHPGGPPADESLTAEQAKAQACNAFRVAGRHWMDAYREWLPAVTTPAWQWADPAVQSATLNFSTIEAEVATQLANLIPANTPTDVAQAIHGYINALLAYSAGHFTASPSQMAAQETEIDDAAGDVSRACA